MGRVKWIDIAKGLLILCVIVGHTINRESIFFHLIFSFHMPAFFIFSGWTARHKPNSDLISSLVRRLLLPYIALALVWNVPQLLINNSSLDSETLSSLFFCILFASGTDIVPLGIPAVGMAWFLAALFVCRLLFNVIQSITNHYHISCAWQGIICLAVSLLGVYCFENNIRLPLSSDVSLYCTFLMWIGSMLSKHHVEAHFLKAPILVLIPSLWITAALNSNLELAARVLTPPLVAFAASIAGTIFICQASLILDRSSWKPTASIGRGLASVGINSMSLYAIHAVDWFIPWSDFPALEGTSLSSWFAAVIRCSLDLALVHTVRQQ